MMLQFRTIDLEKEKDDAIRFRQDSFAVSFGDAASFDEGTYLEWLQENVMEFPSGFVFAEKDGCKVGQLELAIREYKDKKIGYVHLYYLVPEIRGRGMGKELHGYAVSFFNQHQVDEFHLRVSVTNTSAMRFYHKLGMEEAGTEIEGRVMRMKWHL